MPKGNPIDLSGMTFGRLTVVGLSSHKQVSPSGQTKLRWDVRCECGTTKSVMGATLRRGLAKSCGCLRTELVIAVGKRNTKERPTYSSAHSRVYRTRGRAKDHSCLWCSGSADGWAYMHSDPDELTEAVVLPSGSPAVFYYSADPNHYAPLCRSCHSTSDKQQANLRRTA